MNNSGDFTQTMTQQKSRDELKKYLKGDGIEIGALQNPLDLSGLPIARIRYVDRLDIKDLRQHYPELGDVPLVKSDILDDGQALKKIENASLDFIIANHLIEHLDNPLGALETWYRKLKLGGIIFLAIPDKRFTFDKKRPLTSLEHTISDYRATAKEREKRNCAHFKEWVEYSEKRQGKDAMLRFKKLIEMNYSIHFHVWTFESFWGVITYAVKQMGLNFKVLDCSAPLPSGNEFIFILQRSKKRRFLLF